MEMAVAVIPTIIIITMNDSGGDTATMTAHRGHHGWWQSSVNLILSRAMAVGD